MSDIQSTEMSIRTDISKLHELCDDLVVRFDGERQLDITERVRVMREEILHYRKWIKAAEEEKKRREQAPKIILPFKQ
jgi:hypothetical protein